MLNIELFGDKFKPSVLLEHVNLNLFIFNEYGKIASTGRYKGKESPYGFASINEEPTPDNLNKIILKYTSIMIGNYQYLKMAGVDEIKFSISLLEEDSFEINSNALKEIADLNAKLEISVI